MDQPRSMFRDYRMLRGRFSFFLCALLLMPPGTCVCGSDSLTPAPLCAHCSACPINRLTPDSCEADGFATCSCDQHAINAGMSSESFPVKGGSPAPGCPATRSASHPGVAPRITNSLPTSDSFKPPIPALASAHVREAQLAEQSVASGPPLYLAGCALLI